MKSKCCICGCTISNYGNNPWPINEDEDAKCCDDCNNTFVIPARLINAFKKNTEKESE